MIEPQFIPLLCNARSTVLPFTIFICMNRIIAALDRLLVIGTTAFGIAAIARLTDPTGKARAMSTNKGQMSALLNDDMISRRSELTFQPFNTPPIDIKIICS
jgi:hypothetical protein